MALEYDVTVGDGKYRITYDTGMHPTIYRKGELWDRDVLGDGMILALVQRIAELEEEVASMKSSDQNFKELRDAGIIT